MRDLDSMFSGLTFYRQRRMDGGTRTGIMIGQNTILGRFDEGDGEYDPALIWSVDLRCDGDDLPTTKRDARRWLLKHGPMIEDGFRRYADRLHAGCDVTGTYPLEWGEFHGQAPGVEMKIVCTALRRIDALKLATELLDIKEHWREIVSGLRPSRSRS